MFQRNFPDLMRSLFNHMSQFCKILCYMMIPTMISLLMSLLKQTILVLASSMEITFYSACNDPICFHCGCKNDKDGQILVQNDTKYQICNTWPVEKAATS